MKHSRTVIYQEIIKGYRASIRERYTYDTIKRVYDIPNSINEDIIVQLREYFLAYIYPDVEKRAALDTAFESLDDFIKHPQKLIGVVFDAAKLIFTYGKHLPKIIRTGLKAMQSFRAASAFESNMVDEAMANNVPPPYDLKKINGLIGYLSREDIDTFITTSQSLFETLHDKALTDKIIEIIDYIVTVMRSNQSNYAQSQIEGLEFGLEMLKEGNAIFNTLALDDQKTLIEMVTLIERDRLDQLV